jgi:PBP1b-binding outer membrane lipoprotein LpoB
MKKIYALLITIIILFAACQPTPEELVVQNKDKDELMEAIHAEEETPLAENAIADDTQIKETQDVSIEHWTHNVNSGEGTVEINIDADIIIPAYEQLPVVSLGQKTFSDSEMANIVTALVGDREVYEYVSGTTRADIDEQIIKTKMEMTDLNSDMASSAGVETLEELAEIGNQELERLEALLPSAPESIERNVVDKNNLSQLGNEYICLQTDFDKGAPADLIIVNNTDIESSISVILNNTGNMDDHIDNMFFSSESEGSSTLKISKQEVESIAYELLNKLPAESMDISNVEYGFLSKGYGAKKLCYMVSVSRCVNGVYTPNILSNDSSMESETSARPVKPEYMNIYIDDSGIIGFFWSSPMETQEIINENVQTLDFEEIKKYFVQQFLNKYSYEISDSIEYVRYDITEITLNLARIKMPDNPDKYMLVPVWDFFGERCVKYSDSSLLERDKESLRLFEEDGGIQVGQIVTINDNDERVERFEGTSYMTINALNGASINRNLGY